MRQRMIMAYKKMAWRLSGLVKKTRFLKNNFFSLEVSTRDDVIGRDFYLYGSYGLEEIRMAISCLKNLNLFRKGIFLDIGANIGFMSLYMLSENLADSAICIEPDPLNYELLRRNFRHNGFEKQYIAY